MSLRLEDLLVDKDKPLETRLFEIRKIMYTNDFGYHSARTQEGITLRGRCWKALLGTKTEKDPYFILLNELISSKDQKLKDDIIQIDRDITRTFKGSNFVTEEMLCRLKRILAAFHAEMTEKIYIQGMNSVAGALLCVMPELDAYFCYKELINHHVPTYHCRATNEYPGMAGSNYGVAIVILILEKIDPDLFEHLHGHSANMTKFTQCTHMVFSLGGSTPGINGLLRLWDVLFVLGFHINPVICAVRIMQKRESLLEDQNPFNQLTVKGYFGAQGDLNSTAEETIRKIMPVLTILMNEEKLYNIIERHTTDFSVKKELFTYPSAKAFLKLVGEKGSELV